MKLLLSVESPLSLAAIALASYSLWTMACCSSRLGAETSCGLSEDRERDNVDGERDGDEVVVVVVVGVAEWRSWFLSLWRWRLDLDVWIVLAVLLFGVVVLMWCDDDDDDVGSFFLAWAKVIIVSLLLADKTTNNKDDVDINNNNIIDKTIALVVLNRYYLIYSTVEYRIWI